MNVFYRLLWRLPSDLSFGDSVTILLQPGELENPDSSSFWDRNAPPNESESDRYDRVLESLARFYKSDRMGYFTYCHSAKVGVPPRTSSLRTLGREIFRQEGHPKDQILFVHNPNQPNQDLGSSPGPKSSPPIHCTVYTTTAFPDSEDELIEPLLSLPGVVAVDRRDNDLDYLRGNFDYAGVFHIYGARLETADAPYAFNTLVWVSLLIGYVASARPVNNLAELALDPAHAVAHVVTHMSVARQAAFASFARDHDVLTAAHLIRLALENLPMEVILGHVDELEASDIPQEMADEAWKNIMLEAADEGSLFDGSDLSD